jgi:hypothetical protein
MVFQISRWDIGPHVTKYAAVDVAFFKKTTLIQVGKRQSRFEAHFPGHSAPLKPCQDEANLGTRSCCDAEIAQEVSQLQDRAERAMRTLKKMGAGDCKTRHQKPRPQICVVSKVTFFQEG